ncbi:MAG: hypothetical protein U1F43_24070 [Myxococcota bacterium]
MPGGTEVSETDVGDADSVDAPDVPIDPPSTGYPAAGLLVRIVAPGGDGRAEAGGPAVRVAGLLFGNADTMLWQAGAQSGSIAPRTYWQSDPITLVPGDNTITVTAIGAGTSVSDRIVVTYNPSFQFDAAMTARPAVWWVGTPTEAVFTIPSSLYRNADPATVRLVEVDADGQLVADQGPMRDDGLLSASGDEIELDGVFTWSGSFTCAAAGPRWFRASVKVNASPAYTAVSSIIRVDCLQRIPTAACDSHQALLDAAGAALAGGADLPSVLAQIGADLSVAATGPAEDGGMAAWVQFDDGLLGAVAAPDFAGGTRGGGSGFVPVVARSVGAAASGASTLSLGSTHALVLSPFGSELGATDEGPAIAASLEATTCPRFEVETHAALEDAAASIARFRTLPRYGIVSIATHGEVLFGGAAADGLASRYGWSSSGPQEVLWTGSPVRCDALLQAERECVVTSADPAGSCPEGTRCLVTKGTASDSGASGEGICFDDTQADLRLGRALMTNRGYAVTPSFFSAWRGSGGLPSSLVHLGACHSMWNGSLASALYAAGATAITGFSGTVDSAWAHDRAIELFAHAGQPGTVGDFHELAVDPAHPETRWRLFGATNLVLDAAELLNGDFELGSVSGWSTAGDGRVVGQFGDAGPVNGKFMGLVSSGLGFSVETGSLSQTFCIPAEKSRIQIYWRFYSEEFREWCGDETYQDRFIAALVDSAGHELPVVSVQIDDLCQYNDGTCAACTAPVACDSECFAQSGCHLTPDQQVCSGAFNCQCGRYYEGLSESDIQFDRGGVYRTLWRQTTADVSSLAGRGPVTLRLEVKDSGDSLFDTAVLVDKIVIE